MKNRSTSMKRRMTLLFMMGSLSVTLLIAVSSWAILTEDVRIGPAGNGPMESASGESGMAEKVGGGNPSAGFDDGGPGARRNEPRELWEIDGMDGMDGFGLPPDIRASSTSSDTNRPFREPMSTGTHPAQKQRFRFILCACAGGLLLTAIWAFLFWHVITGEFARKSALSARFMSDVAHELKTPLAVIQSMVEHAIRHSEGNAGVERLAADVLEETNRLRSLVTRMLVLAQSDAGKLVLKREKVNISELAKLLAEDVSLVMDDGSVEAKIEDGLTVTGDRMFLTQALQNLTSNAVKYNREGCKIEFSLRKKGDNAEVMVSNGVDPFAPPDTDKMFDRFYRGDASRGSRVEGAGLGLSLAKEVIESSGGDISACIDGDRIVLTTTLPLA